MLKIFTSLLLIMSFSAQAEELKYIRSLVENCVQIRLPNSMARSGGVDGKSEQREIEVKLSASAKVFSQATRFSELAAFMENSQDELDLICGLELAQLSGNSDSVMLFRKYEKSSNKVVAEYAKNLLSGSLKE